MTDTVPLAEQIAAVKRAIIFLEYTEEMALEHHLHDAEIAALQAALTTLEQHERAMAALRDAVAGLRYIELRYGRLDGVGWDRVYNRVAALDAAQESASE